MPEIYQESSDIELVEKVQAGETEAFTQLSVRYLRLIRIKASGFIGAVSLDSEDMTQEGFLGLYDAALSYRASNDVPFKTYAGICIENRMISAVRAYSSGKNRPLNESVPLEAAEYASNAWNGSPERQLEGKEELNDVFQRIKSRLTQLEQRALFLYLNGYSREEIAAGGEMSVKTFDNAVHRARLKIRER